MNVARGKLDRRLDGVARIFELAIILEIGLQAFEDFDGVGNGRLVDVHLLEPAHQRPILLKILPVFLVGGRADAAHRAGSESGLEQI